MQSKVLCMWLLFFSRTQACALPRETKYTQRIAKLRVSRKGMQKNISDKVTPRMKAVCRPSVSYWSVVTHISNKSINPGRVFL